MSAIPPVITISGVLTPPTTTAPIHFQVLLPTTVPPKVVKEGWLYKRGVHIRNWRLRYFILLENGSLVGYRNKPGATGSDGRCANTSTNALNTFSVRGCRITKTESPKLYSFVLRGNLQSTQDIIERMFYAVSAVDRDDWFDVMTALIRRLPHKEMRTVLKPIDCNRTVGDSGDCDTGVCEAMQRLDTSVVRPDMSLANFEFLKVLGKGTFGKVVLCREKSTSLLYAIKIVKKQSIISKGEVVHTLTENRVLRNARHPFIISLKYSFQTCDRLCFVMEYVNGGELYFHLSRTGKFDEHRTRFYSAQIVLALEYLHRIGVIYRDLKLENLLLDSSGNIKITDFGLCKEDMTAGQMTKTFCGTPEYLAPEVIRSKIDPRLQYDRAVDWWALGVLMYEMLCGSLPFDGTSHNRLFKQILESEVKFPKAMSFDAKTLLYGLLMKDPRKRIGGGVDDAQEIKYHLFFRCVQWQDLLDKKITPPFKPRVTSDTDTRYFDHEFTAQSAQLTPQTSYMQSSDHSVNELAELPYFQQFSYQGSATSFAQ